MRAAVLYGPGDVRVEDHDRPTIAAPTDAIIRMTAACVCGSDLWPFRGVDTFDGPAPMGHEYVGVVEEVGGDVRDVRPGQFVVGSFFASDGTCEICRAGYQSHCVHREGVSGAQAEYLRVPLADGTLVATPDLPDPDLVPSLLTASDVLGTGWFGAVAADVRPGKTVAVVGDGAVGLCAVIAAKRLGAEQIILLGRHADRTAIGEDFGATEVVSERGDEAVERVRELTDGLGADSTLECVGLEQSISTALQITRPGGAVGRVGVPQEHTLPHAFETFMDNVTISGGPAPARAYIPELLPDVLEGTIDPGRVFDRTASLDEVPDGYRAMNDRESIKVLIEV
jgi:threonine dehydrogenase-like Zn-dependent dehydrogenase